MTSDDDGGSAVRVFNVLRGEASQIRSTPFGDVGTVFSGQGIELVWVSKLGEPVDQNWFRADDVDLILVIQGQLRFEFQSPVLPGRVLGVGEVIVLPPASDAAPTDGRGKPVRPPFSLPPTQPTRPNRAHRTRGEPGPRPSPSARGAREPSPVACGSSHASPALLGRADRPALLRGSSLSLLACKAGDVPAGE